ncbi:hypothetical protein K2X14_08380 [Acetobacter sp. TBRC 12305]|uniref:Uncharacterized protein n=1 Tax=Acetobacter garciniae TaxID=2817435 RepID=A0A939HIR1_9PROT|nr:hypothetical protein [Acetobacter garciniae]MBO1325183.1 hypothetical protein [Acetobacter garciniae]MBX0344846.1 hypothetical protein [Acetobacter garciniae]
MAIYMREGAAACVVAGVALLAVCLGDPHGLSLSALSDAASCLFRY